MAFETLILQALRNRLAALTLSPALPISWPDLAFTVPQSTDSPPKPLPYLKADLLWNRNINRGISNVSTTEHRGIFQVTVVYPANSGLNAITNIAGEVALWFERGSVIGVTGCTVNITGKPSLYSLPNDGLSVRLAVSINFYAFK